MNVLVTGGTGFVGEGVTSSLVAAGHTVRVLARHPASPSAEAPATGANVHFFKGDISDRESLATAVRGCEAIIHLVGIISEVGRATFENVHVRGTENILRAAAEQGASRFVHMSALGTRPAARSRYHQTKWAAEEAVRNSDLSWTILRPSLIYGPRDAFVNLFARISRYSPILPVPGNRSAQFQPVSLAAVSTAFANALEQSKSVGQTLDLCGPERLTLDGILDVLLAVLGRKRMKLHLPRPLVQVQARLLEWVFPIVLGKAPPLNRDQVIMLQEGNIGDGSAADRLLGLRHPSFWEGISYLRTSAPS